MPRVEAVEVAKMVFSRQAPEVTEERSSYCVQHKPPVGSPFSDGKERERPIKSAQEEEVNEMTFSLALRDGDLVQLGSTLQTVSGANKLQQDMSLWLTERLGVDRFHPRYGSILPNFIGGVINLSTQADVQSEVDRVLGNYQAVQQQTFNANPQLFSYDELLNDLLSVDVGVSYDTVSVAVSVSTGASTFVSVNTQTSV